MVRSSCQRRRRGCRIDRGENPVGTSAGKRTIIEAGRARRDGSEPVGAAIAAGSSRADHVPVLVSRRGAAHLQFRRASLDGLPCDGRALRTAVDGASRLAPTYSLDLNAAMRFPVGTLVNGP